jgi:hypothetical protein
MKNNEHFKWVIVASVVVSLSLMLWVTFKNISYRLNRLEHSEQAFMKMIAEMQYTLELMEHNKKEK